MKRALSAPLDAHGTADVAAPSGWLANLVARAMRLPRPGREQPVTIVVSEDDARATWDRTFGKQRIVTKQSLAGRKMVERNGAGRLVFVVRVEGTAVIFDSVGASLMGIPLPLPVAPSAHGVVTPTESGWLVDVEITMGLLGRLCAYEARLKCT